MSVSQWHMNRLGLVDFWCYENEEFPFYNGHMLLRGSNGSGKSVTMQSCIPLLLDGNRSSERLDPFGTRSRKMETYLIDENSTRDDRTGYLYLEFKREDSELYKTIGMGIHARKNKKLEVWYFVIEDNRRINIDFSLMENRYTLTKKQLENILGNQVINGQKEYMNKVNEALFGFSSLDDYKDAIDLLLQLRSPKLSNSLSPAKINELLASSLQPLSEDDLRPMSDAITSMDNLQDELENLNISYQAAKKIAQVYETYNKAILLDKWQKYSRENDKYKQLEKDIQEKMNSLKQMKEEFSSLQNKLSQNKIDLEIKKNEKNMLMDPGIERLHDDLIDLKARIIELEKQISQKQQQYENKSDKIIDLKNDLDNYQNKIAEANLKNKQAMEMLDEINETFLFSEHSALKETLAQNQPFDFNYTKQRLKEEAKKTQDIMNKYRDYYQILSKIKDIENEMISFDQHLTSSLQILEKNQADYKSCIESYQEYFYRFHTQNQLLKLSDDILKQMSNLLADFEINQDYHSITTLVYQQYMKYSQQFSQEKNKLTFERHKTLNEFHDVDREYQQLLNTKDYEPACDELTLKQRCYLKNNQISYIPFYQLLDFDDQVSVDDQNKIEEILSQMHILDALVVHNNEKEKILSFDHQGHDHYLWTHLLLDDLKPVKITVPFQTEQFISILKTLGIENHTDISITDKYFQSGVLEGTIDQGQVSSFIGIERRQLLRQQKIDELKNQLDLLNTQKDNLDHKIEEIDKQLPLLKEEFEAFQDETELKEKYNAVEKQQKEIDYLQEKIEQLIQQKQKETQHSQLIYQEIKQMCTDLLINVSLEALENRQEAISDYQYHLDDLKEAIIQENNYHKLFDIEQDKLYVLQDDVDTLNYEIITSSKQNEVYTGKVKSIESQLDQLGYSDKQKKLEKLEFDIQQLEKSNQKIDRTLTKIETQESYIQSDLMNLNGQLQDQNDIKNMYHQILLQEVHYGFIFNDDKQLYKNLRQLSQLKLTKTVSDYLANLQSVFFEQTAYLSQYHLTHEVDVLDCDLEDVQGHFLIKANNQGKKIPFTDLLTILQDRIESQKLLIMQEDRHIFEEILVNTIGEKIRNRIQASKRWVDKMERYMHDMNTSSGLQLSLKWRSKKALDDDELDTQELVTLLEKDYRILKESDRQKISQHFRTKIERARRLSLDENTTASFHQLIKEVMDYRQWFEFIIFAKKTNENRKELTNRIFYAYSGGEKAIAMYVPLFSAVAAKFESAREDAPHLIALDEAFAGVDENNIDSLFDLITKFNFDYIMNSQFLWGDYPTCQSLAIYELFRPNNAPYVTKVAYQWNGHKRKAVFK